MLPLEAFFDGAAATSSTRRQRCPSLGHGGSGIGSSECPVTAPQYVHPDFRFPSPKRRFRRRLWLALACLGVVGIGAAMMAPSSSSESDAAMAPRGPGSRAETIPTASPVGYAAVDPQLAGENGAQIIAQKPFCLGPSRSDGNCVSFQPPKVRMVRVAKAPAASVGHQGNSAKPAAAALRAKELEKGIAEPKKAQRSAHRQNQRRIQPLARGYASSGRSEYDRLGFARNFW